MLKMALVLQRKAVSPAQAATFVEMKKANKTSKFSIQKLPCLIWCQDHVLTSSTLLRPRDWTRIIQSAPNGLFRVIQSCNECVDLAVPDPRLIPVIPPNSAPVEFTDPASLFPQVEPLLSHVLPLRNLHWKSDARPLRSIDTLPLNLVAVSDVDGQRTTGAGAGTDVETTLEKSAGSASGIKDTSAAAAGAVGAAKPDESTTPAPPVPPPVRRRHQIPGLRHTPFVRVLLLRCDDNETYKATARRQVREWVKSLATAAGAGAGSGGGSSEGASGGGSGGGSGSDSHDAFDWLVIHVLPPGVEDVGNPASKAWGVRGTTVLEKLRADFNGSGKGVVDRVVQIKIPDGKSGERARETSDGVDDLIKKLKRAILSSFTLRVSQYEEDIREKDSQRNLPGWNFCTFFILKEGLTRGFEHIGLFDDALVGYDELAVGLDAAILEQLVGGNQHGVTFLEYTNELTNRAMSALDVVAQGKSEDHAELDRKEILGSIPQSLSLTHKQFPLDTSKKPYRDMILANNISIFDFRVYIFARQMTLLLKAAQHVRDSLTMLAEVCERACEFISIASRTLRNDLHTGLQQRQHTHSQANVEVIINNMVASWTYAALFQVLDQTATDALDVSNNALSPRNDKLAAAALAVFVADSRPGVPRRSSSLVSNTAPSTNSSANSVSTRMDMTPVVSSDRRQSAGGAGLRQDMARTGSVELASARGDLLLFARRTLENVVRPLGWARGWKELSLLYDESNFSPVGIGMKDVSLHDIEKPVQDQAALTAGLDTLALVGATQSIDYYCRLFEHLTDEIFRHYFAANRTRSAEMVMADIGVAKYRAGYYQSASKYFQHLATFYAKMRWDSLEGAMLELHGVCLKKLGLEEEYMNVLLRVLSKYSGVAHSGQRLRSTWNKRMSSAAPSSFTSTVDGIITKYLADLLKLSYGLSKELTVPLRGFFGGLSIDPIVMHFYRQKHDGMRLQISLRFLFGESVTLNSIRILLENPNVHGGELWFETPDEVLVKSNPTRIQLESRASIYGKAPVRRIEVRVGNLLFSQTFNATTDDGDEDDAERPYVYCYHPLAGLSARIAQPRTINLASLRTIDVELKSGWNEVTEGTLRVRPATAGLRLHIADAAVIEEEIEHEGKHNAEDEGKDALDVKVQPNPETGNIELGRLPRGIVARINIPYSADGSSAALVARLEVTYTVGGTTYSFMAAASIVAALPISVNVQDVFKHDVLFSRFIVRPATMTPLRLLNTQLPSSNTYTVDSSLVSSEPLDVFPKQPASLLYRITPKSKPSALNDSESTKTSSPLVLNISFTCLDEECLSVLESHFTTALRATPFSAYIPLLVPHLLTTFRAQWTAHDLEKVGLLRQIEVYDYGRMHWGKVLSALGRTKGAEVTEWLRGWHAQNRTLSLPEFGAKTGERDEVFNDELETTITIDGVRPRKIVIPVDIPDVPVVHTAHLTVHFPDPARPHAIIGRPLPATLTLKHTRRWTRNRHPDNRKEAGEKSPPLESAYEVLASPDSWLVGGRRRGHFISRPADEDDDGAGEARPDAPPTISHFPLMLLPQRTGHILLPAVDVRSAAPAGSIGTIASPGQGPAQGNGQGQLVPVPCDVDYASHAETVYVSADLGRTVLRLVTSGGDIAESEAVSDGAVADAGSVASPDAVLGPGTQTGSAPETATVDGERKRKSEERLEGIWLVDAVPRGAGM